MSSQKLDNRRNQLLDKFEEKWRSKALSCEPIQKEKLEETVSRLYRYFNLDKPRLLFINNPYSGWEEVGRISPRGDEIQCRHLLEFELGRSLTQMDSKTTSKIRSLRGLMESRPTFYSLWTANHFIPKSRRSVSISPYNWVNTLAHKDLYSQVDQVDSDSSEAWSLVENMIDHCHWLFPYEKVCVCSHRPEQILVNGHHRLHAEGKPAISYSDGSKFYFYDGIPLPDYMAELHPDEWKAEWILSVKNAELRRILVQAVSYEKLCTVLEVDEINQWENYTLLKIRRKIDIEPIYLLKMICPSTGHLHAVRVPPLYQTARGALLWMNWGIRPEAFAQQT